VRLAIILLTCIVLDSLHIKIEVSILTLITFIFLTIIAGVQDLKEVLK